MVMSRDKVFASDNDEIFQEKITIGFLCHAAIYPFV